MQLALGSDPRTDMLRALQARLIGRFGRIVRPPDKRRDPVWALVQGGVAFLIVAGSLFLGAALGMAENELRALVFTVLVLMNIGLILVNRSFGSSIADAILRPNRALWILLSGVLAVLAVTLYWPPAQELFRFGPLHGDDLAICLAAGAGFIVLLEFSKRWLRASLQS